MVSRPTWYVLTNLPTYHIPHTTHHLPSSREKVQTLNWDWNVGGTTEPKPGDMLEFTKEDFFHFILFLSSPPLFIYSKVFHLRESIIFLRPCRHGGAAWEPLRRRRPISRSLMRYWLFACSEISFGVFKEFLPCSKRSEARVKPGGRTMLENRVKKLWQWLWKMVRKIFVECSFFSRTVVENIALLKASSFPYFKSQLICTLNRCYWEGQSQAHFCRFPELEP